MLVFSVSMTRRVSHYTLGEAFGSGGMGVVHKATDDRLGRTAWTIGAGAFAELGEPDKAAEWVGRALAIDPDEPVILHNAACIYGLVGRLDDAIRCLQSATSLGFVSKEWMRNDPDLDPIREHPRFHELLASFE